LLLTAEEESMNHLRNNFFCFKSWWWTENFSLLRTHDF